MDGHFQEKLDEFFLVDCRYPYEYTGGHIQSARNITCVSELEALFFTQPPMNKKVVIVFHCEYSAQRAPQM